MVHYRELVDGKNALRKLVDGKVALSTCIMDESMSGQVSSTISDDFFYIATLIYFITFTT